MAFCTRQIHVTRVLRLDLEGLLKKADQDRPSPPRPTKPNRFEKKFEKPKFDKKPRHPGHNQAQKHKPKPKTMLQLTTGSEQAQNAIKSVILKVRDAQTNFLVKYIDPDTNKLATRHIVADIANKIDLKSNGLAFIGAGKEGELPMVKLVKIEDMIKTYSDALAIQKERELLQQGSKSARNAVKQRLKIEKKKSASKYLDVFWSISKHDLQNQKGKEISETISRGVKFVLNPKPKRRFQDIKDLEEEFVEFSKRQQVYDIIVALLQEFPCTYKQEGDLETKMAIEVTPDVARLAEVTKALAPATPPKPATVKKQRKQRDPTPEKKNDQDLDSMYLFKLDD